jgi:hypothetical protein
MLASCVGEARPGALPCRAGLEHITCGGSNTHMPCTSNVEAGLGVMVDRGGPKLPMLLLLLALVRFNRPGEETYSTQVCGQHMHTGPLCLPKES